MAASNVDSGFIDNAYLIIDQMVHNQLHKDHIFMTLLFNLMIIMTFIHCNGTSVIDIALKLAMKSLMRHGCYPNANYGLMEFYYIKNRINSTIAIASVFVYIIYNGTSVLSKANFFFWCQPLFYLFVANALFVLYYANSTSYKDYLKQYMLCASLNIEAAFTRFSREWSRVICYPLVDTYFTKIFLTENWLIKLSMCHMHVIYLPKCKFNIIKTIDKLNKNCCIMQLNDNEIKALKELSQGIFVEVVGNDFSQTKIKLNFTAVTFHSILFKHRQIKINNPKNIPLRLPHDREYINKYQKVFQENIKMMTEKAAKKCHFCAKGECKVALERICSFRHCGLCKCRSFYCLNCVAKWSTRRMFSIIENNDRFSVLMECNICKGIAYIKDLKSPSPPDAISEDEE